MSGLRFLRPVRNAWRSLSAGGWWATSKRVGWVALYGINIACAWHLFVDHVGFIYLSSGPSMFPTMDAEGEAVLESRMISPQKLARGDLVTYVSPLDPSMIVCKRVLGLPGDIICVDPTGKLAPSTEHVVVPQGHLWMSGDNAEMSRDSRYYGPVSMALVRGKLVAKIWPPSKAGFFQNNFRYLDE